MRETTHNSCAPDLFTLNTTKGTVYLAYVQSIEDTNVDLTMSSVAKNDLCTTAQQISFGIPTLGDLTFALPDETEVSDNCGGLTPLSDPGIWYTFVGPGGRVAVDPCIGLPLLNRISASVYDGGCGPANLACVAVGRIDCGRNELIFETDAGTTYYILINAPSRISFELLVFPIGGVAPSMPTSPVPVQIPTPTVACTITDSGYCWTPNEVNALERLVDTSIANAAIFVDPNGKAVPELAAFVQQTRRFLMGFYDEGMF